MPDSSLELVVPAGGIDRGLRLTLLPPPAGLGGHDPGAASSRHGGAVRLPAAGAQVHSQQLLRLCHAQGGTVVQHADGRRCHLRWRSNHTGSHSLCCPAFLSCFAKLAAAVSEVVGPVG